MLSSIDARLFEKLPKICVFQLQPDFVFAGHACGSAFYIFLAAKG
jgi:hypothetical protein